jgi:hypothetical protein
VEFGLPVARSRQAYHFAHDLHLGVHSVVDEHRNRVRLGNRRAAVQIPSINPIEQLCGLTMDRPKRLNDRRDRQVHVDYLPQSL